MLVLKSWPWNVLCRVMVNGILTYRSTRCSLKLKCGLCVQLATDVAKAARAANPKANTKQLKTNAKAVARVRRSGRARGKASYDENSMAE